MHLATGNPTAEFDGEHVVISVPSGNATVEIAITPAHGQRLARDILNASDAAFEARRTASIEAETDCTALVIDRDAIERSGAMVGWPAALMRALAHRFREMELRQDEAASSRKPSAPPADGNGER